MEEDIDNFQITKYDNKYYVNMVAKYEDYPGIEGRFLDKETCLKYMESSLINEAKDIIKAAKRLEKYNLKIEEE